MIQKIVTGHGTFPKSICESVEMIAGPCEELAGINFAPSMGRDQLCEAIATMIQEGNADQVLIFVDLLQSTPFQSAALAARRFPDKKIYLLSGVNTAMLLEAVLSKGEDIKAVADELLLRANDSLKVFESQSLFEQLFQKRG